MIFVCKLKPELKTAQLTPDLIESFEIRLKKRSYFYDHYIPQRFFKGCDDASSKAARSKELEEEWKLLDEETSFEDCPEWARSTYELGHKDYKIYEIDEYRKFLSFVDCTDCHEDANALDQARTAAKEIDLEKLAELLGTRMGGGENVYNQKLEVHQPSMPLFFFDEYRVETDKCTDELNEIINDGWRVVAVCPQADQRRPDYVLGRQSHEL